MNMRNEPAITTLTDSEISALLRNIEWPAPPADLQQRILDALPAREKPPVTPLLTAIHNKWIASKFTDSERQRITLYSAVLFLGFVAGMIAGSSMTGSATSPDSSAYYYGSYSTLVAADMLL